MMSSKQVEAKAAPRNSSCKQSERRQTDDTSLLCVCVGGGGRLNQSLLVSPGHPNYLVEQSGLIFFFSGLQSVSLWMASLRFELLHCKRRPFATLIRCPCHHSKVVKGHIRVWMFRACVNPRHCHKINGACSCFSHSAHHYIDTSVLRPQRTAKQM